MEFFPFYATLKLIPLYAISGILPFLCHFGIAALLPRNSPKEYLALAGNRTRASRVAGENSTTEPPMHVQCNLWGVFPSQKNSRELYGSSPKNTFATLRIWSTHKTEKRLASPSGNRTPVSRVTSGDTHHYTNEDRYTKIWSSFPMQIFVHLVTYQW